MRIESEERRGRFDLKGQRLECELRRDEERQDMAAHQMRWRSNADTWIELARKLSCFAELSGSPVLKSASRS